MMTSTGGALKLGSCSHLLVRKLEPWTLPRTLGALAERSHPPSAAFEDCLQTGNLKAASLQSANLGKSRCRFRVSLHANQPAFPFFVLHGPGQRQLC